MSREKIVIQNATLLQLLSLAIITVLEIYILTHYDNANAITVFSLPQVIKYQKRS